MKLRKIGFVLAFLFCLSPAAQLGAMLQDTEDYSGDWVVAKGDSLWKIAASSELISDPWSWPLLLQANRDLIHNPNLIKSGWRLRLPLFPSRDEILQAANFARRYGESPATWLESAPLARARTSGVTAGPARLGWPVFGLIALILLAGLTGMLLVRPLLTLESARQAERRRQPRPQPTESEEIIRAMQEAEADGLHREAA
jgi:hypothetical protein